MTSKPSETLGSAGRVARLFVESKLTPLIIIGTLLLGLLAIKMTPREEEPQILVPMVDIVVPFPGATPHEVEERLTTPLENLVWGITDVEYVYSNSFNGGALVTLRFKVGTKTEEALVRVHHLLREHMPTKAPGIGQPLVQDYTIDDVPFLALTLHSTQHADDVLRATAAELANKLSEVPDVALIRTIGGRKRQINVYPNPQRLHTEHVTLLEHLEPLTSGNMQARVGKSEQRDPERLFDVGALFQNTDEIRNTVVGIKGGKAVHVGDVARVVDGPAERTQQVYFVEKGLQPQAAVTLALSKRPGTNATALAENVLAKVEHLKDDILPAGATITVTRNYGQTAREKSNTLIEHLLIASVSVVLLIAFALGIRFSLVVGIAVPVTLALTLMIYYLFGYSLNRVTLFALIFSIGILVDDAIVVVENIHRHLHSRESKRKRTLKEIIIMAVDEVGNPTILATFTVIAAILPMAFVRGLMGPYMRPIPIGASLAMLFSLIIAFSISPWAARKIHQKPFDRGDFDNDQKHEGEKSFLDRLYDRVMGGLIDRKSWRRVFSGFVVLCFAGLAVMIVTKVVRVKMLPFDNKNEIQVVIDMEEGTPLARTAETALAMGRLLEKRNDLLNYQVYVGTSAPFNFNGMVRHYFLRTKPHQADIQINLTDKHDRSLQSHAIAKELRPDLQAMAQKFGARVKVSEIPPGPPVLATLVAEIYGPTHEEQIEMAGEIRKLFEETPGVVDVDWSIETPQEVYALRIDRQLASLRRVPVERVFATIATAIGGKQVGMLHGTDSSEPVVINLRLPAEARQDADVLMNLMVPAADGSFVPVRDLAKLDLHPEAVSIVHKNLQRVVYVTGDVAGREESPVYALAKLNEGIEKIRQAKGTKLTIYSTQQPPHTDALALKWDGEWQITFEVFRDLGIAFAVVMVLMYMLVVGWFQSFTVPLIIMIPIPLSLIGIIPGHWMFGAFFTATSMIGFIAGAGIIVRNSIILVDFIELRLSQGMPLREAVINAGEVRFRPMLLTAAAVVVGSFVILFDPIFQGLAISLMMGEVAATLLSRFAVPLLYYRFTGKQRERLLAPKRAEAAEFKAAG